MKKVMWSLLSALAVLFLNTVLINQAEAARVAVLPIEIDEAKVERANDFNGYYWDIIIDKFKYPEYELLDDEKVAVAVPEERLKVFNKEALVKILDKTDSDIVVAMRLDRVEENPYPSFTEPMLECIMIGEFVGYNRITGKYYNKKINYKDNIEEILTVRNDWQQNVFASELKRYISRTLEDKKSKK